MCKKVGVIALVVVAAFFVLHKLDLDSYLKVWVNKTHKDIQKKIPPEAKIERLRAEIDKLGPEEAKARSAIAEEMTAVNKLKKQIAETKTNLDKKEVAIKELRASVAKGDTVVTIDGTKLPKDRVEASLARQWDSFKAAKEALKSQEELLASREEALEVAKAKFSTMQDKRKEMQAKVEKMDLELRKLRLAQTQNNITVDDSQLATVMSLYDEIDTQIETQKTELALQKGADTDDAVSKALARKAETDKAMKEMDDFFSGTKVTSKKD